MRYYSVLLIIFLFSISLQAQISEELYKLYNTNQFEELSKRLESEKAKIDKSTLNFYQTLFEEDANKAKENYEYLFKNTTGRIQYLSAEKLMQFYYARG